MEYEKRIVCLANSRKTSGRCVAGKELTPGDGVGPWFRPVSTRPTHEISLEERRYQNGQDPQLLEIIAIPCEAPQPLAHQPENHVIDADYYWSREGAIDYDDIEAWGDQPATLWQLGHSGFGFTNNRVPECTNARQSLYLIQVDQLMLVVGPKSAEYPKRIVRGRFDYGGANYYLAVTDPEIEASYLPRADGAYNIAEPYLCVSLGDPYQGYLYKLIAAVLYADRF